MLSLWLFIEPSFCLWLVMQKGSLCLGSKLFPLMPAPVKGVTSIFILGKSAVRTVLCPWHSSKEISQHPQELQQGMERQCWGAAGPGEAVCRAFVSAPFSDPGRAAHAWLRAVIFLSGEDAAYREQGPGEGYGLFSSFLHYLCNWSAHPDTAIPVALSPLIVKCCPLKHFPVTFGVGWWKAADPSSWPVMPTSCWLWGWVSAGKH